MTERYLPHDELNGEKEIFGESNDLKKLSLVATRKKLQSLFLQDKETFEGIKHIDIASIKKRSNNNTRKVGDCTDSAPKSPIASRSTDAIKTRSKKKRRKNSMRRSESTERPLTPRNKGKNLPTCFTKGKYESKDK